MNPPRTHPETRAPHDQVNKTELVKTLATRTGLNQRDVGAVLDALFDPDGGVVPGELAAGRAVAIRGFGTFEVRLAAPRLARNPRTGAPVQIPAQTRPTWRPAAPLRERLNG